MSYFTNISHDVWWKLVQQKCAAAEQMESVNKAYTYGQ